jgi:hypothetical protein
LSHEGKTVAKSFRINENALEALREEARKQTISLNTLVNQLLVSYSEFGRYMRQMHALMFTQQTFAEILNALPEDKLIEAARTAGKSAPEALITSKHGKMTVNAVIELVHFFSAYANLFEYSEKDENGHWTITLTHELGRKWSLFIASYLEQAFETAGVKARYTISDRSTTLNI